MEVKLNRNGWHKKLQIFVLGESNVPRLFNFCPYFWLTNFCILACIPVAIVKLIVVIFAGGAWCFNKAADWFEHSVCDPLFEKAAVGMDEDEILRTWSVNRFSRDSYYWNSEDWADYEFWCQRYLKSNPKKFSYKKQEQMDKKFEIWKSKNPDWEQKLEAIRAERKAQWEKKEAERQKRLQMLEKEAERNALSFILKYTKWVVIAVGLVAAGWVGYWIWRLIAYAWAHFYWDKFVVVMAWIGGIIGAAGLLAGVIYLLVRLAKSTACSTIGLCGLFNNRLFRWIGRGISKGMLAFLDKCIVPGAVKTAGFFKFFWMYIVTVKKDYCPGIIWEDESEQVKS